jgi:hypothetical protein
MKKDKKQSLALPPKRKNHPRGMVFSFCEEAIKKIFSHFFV